MRSPSRAVKPEPVLRYPVGVSWLCRNGLSGNAPPRWLSKRHGKGTGLAEGDAGRAGLRARRLHHRSDRAGRPRGGDPWPWRSCKAGQHPCARHVRHPRDHAHPLRPRGRGQPAAPGLRRLARARRGETCLRPGRPCPGLGPGGDGIWRPACRGLRRLQAPAGSDLRALRAGGLRSLHHGGDLRPAGLPPPR